MVEQNNNEDFCTARINAIRRIYQSPSNNNKDSTTKKENLANKRNRKKKQKKWVIF